MTTATDLDYVERQATALREMAIIVDVVSHTPRGERDFAWWAAVRDLVCQRNEVRDLNAAHQLPPAPEPPPRGLTRRHIEVLQGMADGLTVKEIAAAQHISSNTVKSQGWELRRRMGARNTTHAVAIALREGIIR